MTVQLSDKAERCVEEFKRRYPNARSAIMPALSIAQEELGCINQEAIAWVAQKIGLTPVQVMEVAGFYTMYYKKPVGEYHFQVCRTLSCALRGARQISAHLHKTLGLSPGEVSADGLLSLEEVECLGSCGTAPACRINDTLFENLTPERLDELIRLIREKRPDLRFSTLHDELGEGLPGYAKSEVLKD